MTVTRGARVLTAKPEPVHRFPSPYERKRELPADVAETPARIAVAGDTGKVAVTAAAGYNYDSVSGQGLPSFDLTAEQSEIDFMVENIGWVGFYVQIKAMLGAMCPWVPERKVGGEWVRSDDPKMNAIVSKILPPTRSQAGMRFRSLRLQASIGEHAFWPVTAEGRGLAFEIAHPIQLRKGQSSGMFGVATRRDARPSSAVGYNEFPIERLRRHWIPDDKWPEEASTPLTGILTEMRIYRSLVLNMHRAADSRMLMNGLLWISTDDGEGTGEAWVPDDESFDAGDDTPGTPQGGGLSELVREFSRFGARAFRDHTGSDVASRLPFPFPHHSKPELIDLGRPIDEATLKGLGEVVFAAGRGLNIPTQFLVVGEASANHWNDAEMRRALHERAVFPEVEANNDFWTEYALKPILATTALGGRAIGDDHPDEWRLGYDSSPIDVKSDSASLAMQAWQQGIASRERTAQKLGIAEDDMLGLPSDVGDYEHWVMTKAAAGRAGYEVAKDSAESGVDAGEPAVEPDTSISAGALALLRR